MPNCLLQPLDTDPQQTEQRLGDGFYEQQQVLAQITKLTLGASEQTHTSEHSEEHTSASLFNTGATRFGSLDPEQYSRTSQNSTAQAWSGDFLV